MNFFIKKNIKNKNIKTRFSPEPSGELHLGHLKCIYINYFVSKYSRGNMIIRFDDTNPLNCNKKSIIKIIRDIKNINFYKKIKKINFTSNYFNRLLIIAKIFIKNKFAYVEYKKVKILSIKKNIKIFKMMKEGKIDEKKAVLKSNILTLTKNYNTKLNIMYRIIKKQKYFSKNIFLYPTYNFSHCLCDLFDKINISFCTKEFENNNFFYKWYLKKYKEIFNIKQIPIQIEFSKLKFKNIQLSKRKIRSIKNKSNLMTIESLLNRGIYYKYLIKFCKILGYSKKESIINFNFFNIFIIKKMLKNKKFIFIDFLYNPRCIFLNRKLYIEEKSKKCKKIKLLKSIFKIKILFNNILGKENYLYCNRYIYLETKIKKYKIVYIKNLGFFKKNKKKLKEILTY
ncbi:glutamate--tRNA ligase family protein [Candidatus Vidania fulgoroideae]|uniref:Glutamate--tRNA ligase family protein n=1 Tax=Candidatus Vidania fulgoroideorum TaxID=881286 RepID=A0AAX3NBK7_9PROT|nr:glutamate--tRNA ligase family protein [Candidatus Vidania fulgoroideae]WDR79388.1 glutamate--tRNA ligase family protein [Candidatus Vidania fulgoroideae]